MKNFFFSYSNKSDALLASPFSPQELRRRQTAATAIIVLLFASSLFANVGANNPTGPCGQFNGNVTTGCSYDSFTANATRSITDITVAGAVGEYPLAFTRTLNSRYVVGQLSQFGGAGNWRHSYQWAIQPVSTPSGSTFPATYIVDYPDGREVRFSNTGTGDVYFRGPKGVRDRLEQLSTSNTSACYLHLPDGGKIKFSAAYNNTVHRWYFSLASVIDPYGKPTTISYLYDAQRNANYMRVMEPAGRYLRIYYKHPTSAEGNPNDTVVFQVIASDGRFINYYYRPFTAGSTIYTALTWVRPFSNTDNTYLSTYYYVANNANSTTDRPLVWACIDPLYDGPMWRIKYAYQTTTNGDGTPPVGGQIFLERGWDGTTVSRLNVTGANTRTETRGDIPTGIYPYRTSTYTNEAGTTAGYYLTSSTDFSPQHIAESRIYNSTTGFLSSVRDRRGYTTNYTCDAKTGNVTRITYPTPEDGDQVVLNYSYTCTGTNCTGYTGTNPYYVYSDPSGSIYTREDTLRVSQIQYNDPANNNPTEIFYYDAYFGAGFNQVTDHKLRNGMWEQWDYDSRRRVSAYWDAAHYGTSKPTAWYDYDSYDRVSAITESRGTQSGDANYTTHFEYNLRGQLTKVTHPDGTYIQYRYNPNGTLWWTADERHSTVDDTHLDYATVYTYDDYKRLRTVTTPKRSSSDNLSRTTTYYYDQAGTGEDSRRTAAIPTKVVSPSGKVVTSTYDENLRLLSVTAVGDPSISLPDAVTTYTYDANGNVLTVKDPNGQTSGAVTQYHYDKMNRVQWVIDPIAADRNSNGHTMDFAYDAGSNISSQTRVDDQPLAYEYDSQGRVSQVTGYDGKRTKYTYDASGNRTAMRFEKGTDWIWYFYGYDQLNRQRWMQYAADWTGATRTEYYDYDIANHLWQYTNPAGQVKTMTYDNRGRLHTSSWSSFGPSITIEYDIASRPQTITSSDGPIIGFGYDEANNRTYEDQTVNGFTRRVQTDPDADGNRSNLLVKHGTNFSITDLATTFSYTSRNELRNIYDSNGALFFQYSYDASGNVLERDGQRLHDRTAMHYDALNRATYSAHNNAQNASYFAVSHYEYTPRGNLRDWYRDGAQDDGKGEYFQYDAANQLTEAKYGAANVASPGTGDSPSRQLDYTLSYRNRRSMRVQDFVAHTDNTTNYTNCDLNQIVSFTGPGMGAEAGDPNDPDAPPPDLPDQTLTYNDNFCLRTYNNWTYTYDAEGHLTGVTGNNHTASFTYDAVGRCVKRVFDGVSSTITYDQWTPVAEWDGSGNLSATNVFGLGDEEILCRFNANGTVQRYFKSDPMSNVRFILNSAGTLIEKYTYDAFGAPTITQLNGAQPTGNLFMFSGREYFRTFAFSDMRMRIYSPGLGRFYQADPLGFDADSINLFRFAGNNPLLGGDPLGLDDGDFSFSIDFGGWGFDWSGSFTDSSGSSSQPVGLFGDLSPVAWGTIATSDYFGSSPSFSFDFSSAPNAFSSGSAPQNKISVGPSAGPFIAAAQEIRSRIASDAMSALYNSCEGWLRDNRVANFHVGQNKCNLFVYDMLAPTGAYVPLIHHPASITERLIGRGADVARIPHSTEWARVVRNWVVVPTPGPGDVAAIARPNGTGHVAIVYDSQNTVSASSVQNPPGIIVMSKWGISGTENGVPIIFQRYMGPDFGVGVNSLW